MHFVFLTLCLGLFFFPLRLNFCMPITDPFLAHGMLTVVEGPVLLTLHENLSSILRSPSLPLEAGFYSYHFNQALILNLSWTGYLRHSGLTETNKQTNKQQEDKNTQGLALLDSNLDSAHS